jgi:hypothetical protein
MEDETEVRGMPKGNRDRVVQLRKMTDRGEKRFWANDIHEIDDACINTTRALGCDAVFEPEREELRPPLAAAKR